MHEINAHLLDYIISYPPNWNL